MSIYQSEALNREIQWSKEKEQKDKGPPTMYKTRHRKQKIEKHEAHKQTQG